MVEEKTTLSLQEALTIQLDELELLETAYPELEFDTPDARLLLRAILEDFLETSQQGGEEVMHHPHGGEDEEERWLRTSLASAPLLSFRCPLPLKGARLRARMPRRYPDEPLVVFVEGTPRVTASERRSISGAAEGEANRLSGSLRREPHCLQVLGEAMRTSAELADREQAGVGKPSATEGGAGAAAAAAAAAAAETSDGNSGGDGSGDDPRSMRRGRTKADSSSRTSKSVGSTTGQPLPEGSLLLGRRLIYSHHIIAAQKRTGILKTARELSLGGFSKVGWPGVIVIEGEESSCEDFVSTIRRWRWKHLAVRGEETERIPEGKTLDQERLLPLPLEELSEKEGVSALADRCRGAGLSDLFSTLLR